MRTPLGPSLRVMMALQQDATDIALSAVEAAWGRWISPERFGRRLARLERAGLIASTPAEPDTTRVVQLTEAGRLAARGGRDPEAAWARNWDGQWRMVLFDVRESKRTVRVALQRRLRRLSFGYLQDSVWISPDPLETLAAAIKELSMDAATLTLLEARPCGGETDGDLALGAWDFTSINRHYQDYLDVLRHAPSVGARHRHAWLQVEWRAWCRALSIDPLLPGALLPHGYRGREAWEARRDRMQALVHAD